MRSGSAPISPSAAPSISVVIPAYNREKTVARAIESALAQTQPSDEIIVVDDGSVDGTLDRIRPFPEVRVISQENAGAAAARNRGVREATSEWIAFLDSDDYWNPEHLAHTVAAIHATEGRAGVYFSNLQRPPNEGCDLQWEVCGYCCDGPYEFREDGREWAMAPRQPLMLQSSVYRRDVLLEVGGIWEALQAREDTHLFFKLFIGRPACAVSYLATIMTDDDASGGRLSVQFRNTAEHLEQTVMVYRDLLHRCKLSGAERHELRARLAAGYLGLGKWALRERHFSAALGHLGRAFLVSPPRFLGSLGRRAGASQHPTAHGEGSA